VERNYSSYQSIFSIIYFRHTITTEKKKKPVDHKRHSAPPVSEQIKNRFRSPFSPSLSPTTTAVENGTNGNHSEEYESPQKVTFEELFFFCGMIDGFL
jgi:hypothetical protein